MKNAKPKYSFLDNDDEQLDLEHDDGGFTNSYSDSVDNSDGFNSEVGTDSKSYLKGLTQISVILCLEYFNIA